MPCLLIIKVPIIRVLTRSAQKSSPARISLHSECHSSYQERGFEKGRLCRIITAIKMNFIVEAVIV
ncbi:hypothetical protein MPC1_2150004 [Methylocella tundrae]|nr:hypothetical protein MPC1_2150004 [Methylocella tundrae]